MYWSASTRGYEADLADVAEALKQAELDYQYAPWPIEVVAALIAYQNHHGYTPYTCQYHHNVVLEVTWHGMRCPWRIGDLKCTFERNFARVEHIRIGLRADVDGGFSQLLHPQEEVPPWWPGLRNRAWARHRAAGRRAVPPVSVPAQRRSDRR